jgi:hypothetical protein
MAAVYSFIVDAGNKSESALRTKSVSPRVRETTATPQAPLRVALEISAARSRRSAGVPRGCVGVSGPRLGAGGRAAAATEGRAVPAACANASAPERATLARQATAVARRRGDILQR